MIKSLDKKIRAYALKNAIHYEGKANPGSVISALFNEGLKKEEVKSVMPKISEEIKRISKLNLEEQKKEFEKLEDDVSERESREGLPELPNVPKTGVVMRFRPAPSGPLHVGHIIAGMPSSLYVKKYGGKFYIVFDDTDPERVVSEAYESIKKDLDWIFGNVTEYIASSDRMEIYYKYAEKMINSGKAYVCTCSQEEFKKFAGAKKECPCRKINTKENSERWKKMLDKKGYNEGEAVLRFKLNMKDPNPAMRDFPLARINAKKHARQGKKYRVWPLMNLVVPIDDMEFGMTHIIRGKDHMDNAKRQEKIFEVFGKKYPWAFFVGRIKFSDLELSKRKIIKKIEEGEYSGWDDERLPTVASLRKRGFKPEAFAKFVEQRGLSEVDKVITTQDFFKIIDIFGRE
jgi:glutamyl-tRNA synthetase